MIATLVASELTKRIAWGPCKVVRLFGYNNNAAADRYIQLFEQPTVAAGDVPACKGLFAPTAAPVGWELNVQLSELLVAISTTQATYTAPGANTGVDLSLIVETDFPVGANNTIVGDLTSAVANRQIWANASGHRRLYRLDIYNTGGADIWAIVQASDAALTTDRSAPLLFVPVGQTKQFDFGRAGYIPYRKDADGTEHKGCTVRIATGADGFVTYPFAFTAGTDYFIRGIHDV